MLSGTETFTNSNPVAPLSTTPHPTGFSNLNASDFTYLGTQSAGGSGYNWVFGLAYRPETHTFFSIGQNGFPDFDLVEYSDTGPGGQFQVVKDWGNLNSNNILRLPSPTPGQESMQGLWWDDANQRLWLSWGNYYNADHTNDQVLAYVTLNTGSPVVHGPWGVNASVGSDRVKSEITAAPPQLAAITGNPWLMFGGRSSTDQYMSFGAGLVSVADPSQLAAGSLTSAQDLIDWPMQSAQYPDPSGNGNDSDYYSDFPTGASVIKLFGNEDVNPPTQLSYQYNLQVADGQHYIEGDALYNYAWIDAGSVEGFVYIGHVMSGYGWYGNSNAHDDTSATGVQYANNMTSVANPGQPLVDSVAVGRGNHADQWQYNAYFVNYQDVLNAATAVKNGTATAATLQIAPNSIASLDTLGGAVPIGDNALYNMSSFFDPASDNYYLLSPNLQQIFIWHVAPTAAQVVTPGAPTGATATAAQNQVLLSWSPVPGADSYTVYRGTTSGGEAATPLIANLTGSSLVDPGVSIGNTYYYQIAAVNSAGISSLSQEVFASVAPPAPTGLSATAGNGKVSLSWTPAAGATSYNVYRGTTSGGEVQLATGVTADSFTDATAANLQTYYFQVTALEPGAESAKSAELAATPMTPHERYVEAVYNDVLGRAADLSGLVAWAHDLDVGMPVSSVAQLIAHSTEYYARFVIEPAFEKLLGRQADNAAVTSFAALMQSGRLTDQQLEGILIASNEFWTDAGGTSSGWLNKVYENLLGRAPDASGLAAWDEALASGETYGQIAQAIAASQENNSQLIEADYSHYLGRTADEAGLAAWLQEFAAGQTNEDVIAGFTGSPEYYALHTH